MSLECHFTFSTRSPWRSTYRWLDSMLLNLMPNVASSSQHVLYYSMSVAAGGFSVKSVMAELIATWRPA